jgi:hypothetical protein
LNCGDWVESLTAIIETYENELILIKKIENDIIEIKKLSI